MSSFHLRLLAILTMTIDHVGRAFYPGEDIFYILGRLAFPLFAFLIAEGARQTKNVRLYLFRLFLFACLSQIPFIFANQISNPTFSGVNVLFTLFLGLLAITLWQKTNNRILKIGYLLTCVFAAFILKTDYMGFGVLSVFLFYAFRNNQAKLIFSQVSVFSLFCVYTFIKDVIEAPGMWVSVWNYIPLALFSLVFISYYSGKEGLKLKYFFYAFYPAHLVVIILVKHFF